MREVNGNAYSVHLTNHLLAKFRHAMMRFCSSCRVADIVVAIMAKSDIFYSSVMEMLNILQVVF